MNELIINYEPFTMSQNCILVDRDNDKVTKYNLNPSELETFIRQHQFIDKIVVRNSRMFNKKPLENFENTNIKICYI